MTVITAGPLQAELQYSVDGATPYSKSFVTKICTNTQKDPIHVLCIEVRKKAFDRIIRLQKLQQEVKDLSIEADRDCEAHIKDLDMIAQLASSIAMRVYEIHKRSVIAKGG